MAVAGSTIHYLEAGTPRSTTILFDLRLSASDTHDKHREQQGGPDHVTRHQIILSNPGAGAASGDRRCAPVR